MNEKCGAIGLIDFEPKRTRNGVRIAKLGRGES